MPHAADNFSVHPFANAAEPGRSEAPCCFLRITSTGGSTLEAFLRSIFLESEIWHCCDERGMDNVVTISSEELLRYRIVSCRHFAGRAAKLHPLPLRYFTLLRDPLQRAVSYHAHVMRDSAHYLHSLAKELGTFGAFLRDERTQPTVVNFQLRCLASRCDAADIVVSLNAEQLAKGELDRRLDTSPLLHTLDEELKTAFARLDQMCVVGLSEQFKDFVGLLCETFEWPRQSGIQALRPELTAVTVGDLPTADFQLLSRLNEADIELYQVARARFERDWSRSRFVYPHLHAFVSYAQNAEDVLLFRALKDVRNGTYIDVGANDPVGDSVTKAFYDRGWRGINIEPVKVMYDALVATRPEDVNVHAAAGESDGELPLHVIAGTGLSTLDKSIADRHREHGFKVDDTVVAVRALSTILAEFPKHQIHFLKIDVEGWEREVLLGIDLDIIRPWIIVIESTEPNTQVPSHSAWEKILLNHRYSFAFFDGLNRYYLAHEHQVLMEDLSRPVNSGDLFVRNSELSALQALREAQWNIRRESHRAHVAEVYCTGLMVECDKLRAGLNNLTEIRDQERIEAEAYGRSLVEECGKLRTAMSALSEARDKERIEGEAYGKSLVEECERLRTALSALSEARERERVEGEAYARSLVEECDKLRAALSALSEAREKERSEGEAYGRSLVEECEKLRTGLSTLSKVRERELSEAEVYETSLVDECQRLRAALSALNEVRERERSEGERYGESLLEECNRLRVVVDSIRRASELERAERALQLELLDHRAINAEVCVKSLTQECEDLRAELNSRVNDVTVLREAISISEGRIRALQQHWAVKVFVRKHYF